MPILRGEIYFVELGPTRGREMDNKRRPVMVLSADAINRKPLVVTVIPGTTRPLTKTVSRHEVRLLPTATNGLTNPTVLLCFQIRALDHSRFDRPPVGSASLEELDEIEAVVKVCLGFQ